jgi:glycosyltransferase involved in cell wall biosynthesis
MTGVESALRRGQAPDTGPRRVALVITRLSGGAGVVCLRGALDLDPLRYRPTIITGEGTLVDAARAAGIETLVRPTLRATIAPRSDWRGVLDLTDLFARREFDIVHTHCAKAGAIGRVAARRTQVPVVVHTFHGFPFHRFQSVARQRAYIGIERHLGRFTDIALCVGTAVAAEAASRRLVAPERIRTIGVPVDRDAPTRNARTRAWARAELGLPTGSPVVGAVGRLTYQKAPEDFVAAMVALRDTGVTGVWIGDGELTERVRLLAARALPGTRILLTGDRADVPDLLPAFDVFALPSRYEGLPLSVVEAMVCGVPVVATAVNAVPDVVAPGRTGLLVPPRRPELLAAAVRWMLDHPVAARRMAATAQSGLSATHSRAALAETLHAAYACPATRVGVHA